MAEDKTLRSAKDLRVQTLRDFIFATHPHYI